MRITFRIALAGLISLVALGLSSSANVVTDGSHQVVHCCAAK